MTVQRIRDWLRGAPYLRKWVALAALIGVIGGLGAVLFSIGLDVATHLLLGVIAGFTPPTPFGEGGSPITGAARPWLIPLVVAGGGLIAGIIVVKFAPEAEGHGTDAAIAAFHHHPRRIRARIPLVKLVASAITIGSGGSGGREGPTAQISAGFGSFLARWLDLDARDARIAVAAGMGAGIGAIFRAPLGGAILGAEILYRDDVESDALVPSFIASIVAYSIFGAFLGFTPIFGQATAAFTDPRQLLYYALIGILAGAGGRVYIWVFATATARFKALRISPMLKPALAGLVVGGVGIVVPGVLGTGYGWVQVAMDRDLLGVPLWMILILPFAKILATSLTIGSGGSGGIFGPGMVIGGLLGASLWRILDGVAPLLPISPAPFVIVAMMALFGSIAHAPLAVMLMVAEMTGNLGMLAPAMIAVGLASVVVGERSIYASQLGNRAESPAHRFRFAEPLLAAVPVGDALRTTRSALRDTDDPRRWRALLAEAGVPGAPVIDRHGRLAGVVTVARLKAADEDTPTADLLEHWPTVDERDGLDVALDAFANHRVAWLPVVRDEALVGIVSARDVMSIYRRARDANVRRLRDLSDGTQVFEGLVADASPLAGRAVSEIRWPRDSILIAVRRDEELIMPRGALRLEVGDRVALLVSQASAAEARSFLSPTPSEVVAAATS